MIAGPEDLVVGRWGARFRGRRLPCSVGRCGIGAAKREGDGRTPAGTWRLTGGMWRADRMARPRGGALRPSGPRDRWSDDPADPGYNRLRRGDAAFSAERMRRGDPLYDIVLFSDWNMAGAPGAGSAIFLHVWRRPRAPTAGCVAFARRDLLWLWARWGPRSRVVVQAG